MSNTNNITRPSAFKKCSFSIYIDETTRLRIEGWALLMRAANPLVHITNGAAVVEMAVALNSAGWVPGQQVLIYENKGLVKKTKA